MERYKNLGGDSGVTAYQIEVDSIKVSFNDGSLYEYTQSSAGTHNVNQMKVLAEKGEGLNSFINRIVKKKYSQKIR